MTLTHDRVNELLQYNKESGILTWKVSPRYNIEVGDVAGTLHPNGYIYIKIKGKRYLAHRLIFLLLYGEFPPNSVDHINNVRSDNRRCNLRRVTIRENNQKNLKYKNNTSGVTGVGLDKRYNRWYARLNGKHIGNYKTKEEAIKGRLEYERTIR